VFVLDGLWNAFQMGWEVWWALVLGFLFSALVEHRSEHGGKTHFFCGPGCKRRFDADPGFYA
jgi:hypothetical protein